MRAHLARKGLALLIINLSTRWGWLVIATPRPVYLQERAPVLIVQKAGGPHGRSGRARKRESAILDILVSLTERLFNNVYSIYIQVIYSTFNSCIIAADAMVMWWLISGNLDSVTQRHA
jgi:hypothetical protein